jgi:CheY-like chemotaxis protein
LPDGLGGRKRQVAVEALATAQPDVIILDLMMPKMDGFEFLGELRLRPEWQDVQPRDQQVRTRRGV